MYMHLARYVQCPPSVFCVSPRVASPVRMRACVTSWVSLSPGTRWKKGSGVSEVAGRLPEEGDPPPLPLRERCHGAAAEVLFFGGKFGIKQGMRGELVIKIGLGVSVRVDGKPRLKCVDCLFPPHTHTI